jgi:predicted TIM-barrel fold metal-dependent hydrolase
MAAKPAVVVPTIDAHHHLWDLEANAYPWLTGPPVEAHFGPYERIRKSYLIEDYLRDIRHQQVVGSVHVEAGCDPTDPVRETRWLQAVADRHGYPHAIVAFADLTAPDVGRVLEAHRAFPNVRGVRMMARKPGELRRADPGRSVLGEPAFHRGFALLGELGLSFDLQAPVPLMAEAAALADAFPRVRLVLTHAGLPLDRSGEGLAAWRQGLRRLAARPNVAVKVSGIPMTDWRWTVDSLRPIVLETIEIFGVDRAMVGSNFPVDGLYSDYDTLMTAYRAIVAGFPLDDQRRLFHDTAARLYRI